MKYKFVPRIFLSLIIGILLFTSLLVFIQSSYYKSEMNPNVTQEINWWNEDWLYRKELVITDNVVNVTNYQLLITLNGEDYNEKIDPLIGDLRFIDSYNNTLNYWIEEWHQSGICRVWVKIPELLKNTNSSIFMYYNNDLASSESNGYATFIVFEDFDSNFNLGDNLAEINGWSVEFGNPTIQENPTGRSSLGLRFQQQYTDYYAHGAHFNWSSTLQNISLSYYWNLDNYNIRNGYHHFFSNETQMTSTRFVNGVCDWWDGEEYYYFNPDATYSTNEWHLFEQITTVEDYILKINGTEHLGELTHPNNGINGFSWRTQEERTFTYFIDDVYVRQYINDEPSVIFMDEETISITTPSSQNNFTFNFGLNFPLIVTIVTITSTGFIMLRKMKNK